MKVFFLIILFLVSAVPFAQVQQKTDSLQTLTLTQPVNSILKNKTKQKVVLAAHATVIIGSLATLSQVWYSKEPRRSLGSFNDSKEWLQVDKVGHGFSTYAETKLGTSLWKWGNLPHKKSVILGASIAWLYQMSFELMDGTVATYGFSWSDVAANTLGAGLYAFQALQWNQQRIVPKLSYWRQKYDPAVLGRVRSLYGDNGLERFLKDYNGQTYWLSANLYEFAPKTNLPKWLNIAVGYGADGMLGGFENKWTDTQNNLITRYDVTRSRQWYLSPDIDFSKIKTNRKLVKILFFVLNSVKTPMPSLMLQNGKLKVKAIAF